MKRTVYIPLVLRSVKLRNDYGCARGQSHKKSHNQIDDLRSRTADGSQSFFSHKSSYDYGVSSVIKLLKEGSHNNGKEKQKKLFPDYSLSNLIDRWFLFHL